jgi:hypothetical protein
VAGVFAEFAVNTSGSFCERRCEPLHSTEQLVVVDFGVAFRGRLSEISEGQAVTQLPVNREQNDTRRNWKPAHSDCGTNG